MAVYQNVQNNTFNFDAVLMAENEQLNAKLEESKEKAKELEYEIESLQDRLRELGDANFDALRQRISALKNQISEIRKAATDEFKSFLSTNDIATVDKNGVARFKEIFDALENGSLTAKGAIARFKADYADLLNAGKSGGVFDSGQVNDFATKIEAACSKIEELSNTVGTLKNLENALSTIASTLQEINTTVTQISSRSLGTSLNLSIADDKKAAISDAKQQVIDYVNVVNQAIKELSQVPQLDIWKKIAPAGSDLSKQFNSAVSQIYRMDWDPEKLIKGLSATSVQSAGAINGYVTQVKAYADVVFPFLEKLRSYGASSIDTSKIAAPIITSDSIKEAQKQQSAAFDIINQLTGGMQREASAVSQTDEALAAHPAAVEAAAQAEQEKLEVAKQLADAMIQEMQAIEKSTEAAKVDTSDGWHKSILDTVTAVRNSVQEIERFTTAAQNAADAGEKIGASMGASKRSLEQIDLGKFTAQMQTAYSNFNKLGAKPVQLEQNMERLYSAWSNMMGAQDDKEKAKALNDFLTVLGAVQAQTSAEALQERNNAQIAKEYANSIKELGRSFDALTKINTLFQSPENGGNGSLGSQLEKMEMEFDKIRNKSEPLVSNMEALRRAFAGISSGFETGNIQQIIDSYRDFEVHLKGVKDALSTAKTGQGLIDKAEVEQQKAAAKESAEAFKELKRIQSEIASETISRGKLTFADGEQYQRATENIENLKIQYREFLNASRGKLDTSQLMELLNFWKQLREQVKDTAAEQKDAVNKLNTASSNKNRASEEAAQLREAKEQAKQLKAEAEQMGKIQIKLDLGTFKTQLDEVQSKAQHFKDALSGQDFSALNADINKLADAYRRMNDTGLSDGQRVAAYKEFSNVLQSVTERFRQLAAAEKQETAANKQQTKDQNQYLNDQKELERQLRQVIEMKQKIANAGGQGTQQYQDLVQLEQTLRNLKGATPTELNEGLKGTALRLEEVRTGAVDAGGALSNMRSPLGMLQSRLTYMFSLSAIILKAVQSLKQMIKTTVELDSKMTELRIVTNNSESDYAAYSKTIAATAQEIGASMSDLIDSTTVYARLGNTLEDSAELARVTAMLQNVGNIDVSTAQDAITSITKAFNDVDPSNIESAMDKLVVVGNNFPISVSQLAEGFNNAGSTLAAAGNSFEQSVALLTAANTTIQNISKSSTGLRTITARIRKTKYELDDLGEVVEEASYQKALDILTGKGVKLTENGEFRATYDILKDIAAIWNELGSMQQASIAEALAGNRQQNVFYSIVEQFDEATSAMDRMQNSDGALEEAYAEYGESIQKHVDSLKAAWQSLSQSIVDSDLAKNIVDFATGFVNVFDRIIEKFNVIKPLITGFVAYLTAVNGKAILASTGISAMATGISTLTKRIIALTSMKFTGAIGPMPLLLSAPGKIALIVAAITAVVMGVKRFADGWQEAYLEAHPTLEMMQEDVQETTDKIDELQQKIAENKDRYAELQQLMTNGAITAAQETELRLIESQNAQYEEQLQLLLKIQQYQQDLVDEAERKSNYEKAKDFFDIERKVWQEDSSYTGGHERDTTSGYEEATALIQEYLKEKRNLKQVRMMLADAIKEYDEYGTAVDYPYFDRMIGNYTRNKAAKANELREMQQQLIEMVDAEGITSGQRIGYMAMIGKIARVLGESTSYDPFNFGEGLSENALLELTNVQTLESFKALLNESRFKRSGFMQQLLESFSDFKQLAPEEALYFSIDREALEEQMREIGEGGGVDLLVRPVIDTKALNDKGWAAGEGAETLFSSRYSNQNGTIAVNFTPIFTDDQGNVHILTPSELDDYAMRVIEGLENNQDIRDLDTKGLTIGGVFLGEDAIEQAEEAALRVHELQGIYYQDAIQAMEASTNSAEQAAQNVEAISERIKTYKESLKSLQSYASEAFSDTGLSMDSVNSIKEIFSELEGFDPSVLFETTAAGIQLDTEALELFTEALENKKLAELDKEIKAKQDELEELRANLGDLTDDVYNAADAADEFTTSTEDWDRANSLQEEISNMQLLRAEIVGATSAYYDYINAKGQTDKRNRYGTIGKDYEGIGELIEQGWSGDAEVTKYLDYVFGNNRTGDNITDYQRMAQKIAGTDYAITDFFTKDEQGNPTSDGIYNLLDAMQQVSDFVKQNEDESWDIDLSGDHLDQIAEKLGMSREAIEDILRAAEDIDGTDLNWGDNIDSTNTKIKSAQEALEGLSETDITLPEIKGTDTIDELQTKVTTLREALAILQANNGEGGQYDAQIKSLEEAIDAVQRMIDELESDPHEVPVTPKVDKEKLTEEVTATEENQVTLPVDADTEQAAKQIDDFRAKQEADKITIPVTAQPTANNPQPTQQNTVVTTEEFAVETNAADNARARLGQDLKPTVRFGVDATAYYSTIGDILRTETKTIRVVTEEEGEGSGDAQGTAFAGGTWGAKKSDGFALVGEVGPEIRVRDGRWTLLGSRSAEIASIRKGDIIFNAEQTRQILANGKITNGLKRGVAYVSGTIPGRRSVAPDYHYTNPGNSAVGNATQNDKNKQKIDWIEVAVDRIERIIESMTRSVESVFLRLEKRLQASADAIAKTREEIELARAGADRYFEEAEKVDLSEEIKNLIRNGAIDIAEYDKKTADKIKEYQEWYRTMPLYMVTYIENFI